MIIVIFLLGDKSPRYSNGAGFSLRKIAQPNRRGTSPLATVAKEI